jgi:hypothetical protein
MSEPHRQIFQRRRRGLFLFPVSFSLFRTFRSLILFPARSTPSRQYFKNLFGTFVDNKTTYAFSFFMPRENKEVTYPPFPKNGQNLPNFAKKRPILSVHEPRKPCSRDRSTDFCAPVQSPLPSLGIRASMT